MNTFVVDDISVTVPPEVNDLESFRQWARSEECPEEGWIAYLQGQVWIDMSKEQIFSHNQVKNEIAFVLTGLAKRKKLGRFYPDGVLLTNRDADLSCRPDGVFVEGRTLDAGRVRMIEGAHGGFVELEGSPDVVLEVVSRGSVEKDTETMLELYWQAGIEEYWLVDARGAKPYFVIYQSAARGYVAVRKSNGWQKSRVFGESFRHSVSKDERGDPEFALEIAP
jgi:Uma2 family endonuclease